MHNGAHPLIYITHIHISIDKINCYMYIFPIYLYILLALKLLNIFKQETKKLIT